MGLDNIWVSFCVSRILRHVLFLFLRMQKYSLYSQCPNAGNLVPPISLRILRSHLVRVNNIKALQTSQMDQVTHQLYAQARQARNIYRPKSGEGFVVFVKLQVQGPNLELTLLSHSNNNKKKNNNNKNNKKTHQGGILAGNQGARFPRNYCSISRHFGANLNSRSVFPIK